MKNKISRIEKAELQTFKCEVEDGDRIIKYKMIFTLPPFNNNSIETIKKLKPFLFYFTSESLNSEVYDFTLRFVTEEHNREKKSKQIEIIGGFPLLANTSVLKDINKDFERLDRKVFFHSSNEFFIKLKIHFLFRFKFRGEICNNNFFFWTSLERGR